MQSKDTYKEPITIEFPGMVARVYLPILEPQERERRMKNIAKAAAQLLEGVKK